MLSILGLPACSIEETGSMAAQTKEQKMQLTKLTPVLMTHDVDACVRFWEEFGLNASITVPGKDGLSFAILDNGSIELMYQTFEMANAQDSNAIKGVQQSVVYFDATVFDELLPIAQKHEVVKPLHTTPYGLREIYIRDPAGNLIGFSEAKSQSG